MTFVLLLISLVFYFLKNRGNIILMLDITLDKVFSLIILFLAFIFIMMSADFL